MSRDVPPEGWRLARLGDLTEIVGGTTPSKANPEYWEGGCWFWATPSDITALPMGQTRLASTKSSVSDQALKETSLKMLPAGSVLMTSRATIGFAAINTVPMATNQGFANFLPSKSFDPTFLLQWIAFSRPILENAAGGSTFPEISKATLKSIPISIPPLAEQRRIAKILSSVDEAIAATRAVIEQTRKVKQGALERLLVNDRGNGTPPFRVKGTPVRACEGHAG
ncbi:restriction endonuclease subunit S [Aerobium aerolatum]|uniref:Type I restriction modification DNA specificity domain-containing protein n=1 Tax=Aquamicrobium aerolatum DSM 21857 TaxID=1121003 RepID=A0A1I3LZX0_9HYPH|nr:restriction endonuclease subunit S [Aquamicrobium aerolatum]SFI89986.1 Type I restriction modification DNA specificity domain-containing protein [Aquamicrobium aerolatum DSM 21857]